MDGKDNREEDIIEKILEKEDFLEYFKQKCNKSRDKNTVKIFDDDYLATTIPFYFNFKELLSQLPNYSTDNYQKVTFTNEIDFSNVVFRNDVDFSNIIFEKHVNFQNCIFEGKLICKLTNFKSNIDFRNCVFEKIVDFSYTSFENDTLLDEDGNNTEISFNESRFKSGGDFLYINSNIKMSFKNVSFDGKLDFGFSHFKKDVDFNLCTFKESVYFNDCTFEKNVSFSGSILKEKMNFKKAKFKQSADFSACTFEKDVSFYSSCFQCGSSASTSNFKGAVFKGKTYFQHVNFGDKVNFNKASFEKQAYFGLNNKKVNDESSFDYDMHDKDYRYKDKTIFNEACFKRVIFKDEVDFKYVTFEKKIAFTYSTFEQEADFKYARFYGNEEDNEIYTFENTSFYERGAFWEIEIANTLTFNNIKLTNKSNLYIAEIYNDSSEIRIINTVINGRIDFNNIYISKLNLEGSNIVGTFNRINLEAYPCNFDTACILKNEELKRNNTIKALEFKAIEAKLYTKHLKDKGYNSIRTLAEIFSLGLSKLSNDHGQSWTRAVAFIFFSSIFFFGLSQIFVSIDIVNVILKWSYIFFFLLNFYSILVTIFDKKEKHNKVLYFILISICLLRPLIIPCFLYPNLKMDIIPLIKDYSNYLIPTNFDLMKAVANIDITVSLNPNMKINELIETTVNASSNSTASYSNLGIFNLIGFYFFYILGKLSIGYGVFEVVQAFRKFNSKG